MSHSKSHRFTLSLALVLVAIAALPVTATALQLNAKVFLTQNKIPQGLTEQGLLRFVKSKGAKRLHETSEAELQKRVFKAEMVTQFNAPPGDLEFHVLFYDVEGGSRQFVEDMSSFINDRKQKVFLQRINLARPRFKPNRKMELVVTVRRAEVGSLKFTTDGEEVRHSGKVDFGPNGQ